MSLKMCVVSASPEEKKNVKLDNYELVDVLGDKEENYAVQLEELLNTVVEPIKSNIEHESELTIEITGSTTLKASGGVKWLFFNIGSEGSKSGTMKITLKTKIMPEN